MYNEAGIMSQTAEAIYKEAQGNLDRQPRVL